MDDVSSSGGNESDNQAVAFQSEISEYQRHRWLKLQFNFETKRVWDPPKDFNLLRLEILKRFKQL